MCERSLTETRLLQHAAFYAICLSCVQYSKSVARQVHIVLRFLRSTYELYFQRWDGRKTKNFQQIFPSNTCLHPLNRVISCGEKIGKTLTILGHREQWSYFLRDVYNICETSKPDWNGFCTFLLSQSYTPESLEVHWPQFGILAVFLALHRYSCRAPIYDKLLDTNWKSLKIKWRQLTWWQNRTPVYD